MPPALTFTPYSWAKLLFLRDLGDTEVGGFGISSADDLLLIEDVKLIGQTTSIVTVEFDDIAVADFFDEQIDSGLPAEQFFRVWLHTHPGDSALPSGTDEETFARVFGRCDWAVMAILAVGGETYARLRFNAGPGGECEIPVRVDYSVPFAAADRQAWEEEYERCVKPGGRWYESAGFTYDQWDWPVQLDVDDFGFLEQGRLDDDDEFGSFLPATGLGAEGEVE